MRNDRAGNRIIVDLFSECFVHGSVREFLKVLFRAGRNLERKLMFISARRVGQ